MYVYMLSSYLVTILCEDSEAVLFSLCDLVPGASSNIVENGSDLLAPGSSLTAFCRSLQGPNFIHFLGLQKGSSERLTCNVYRD